MTQNTELKEVCETNPCLHCGKASWCYRLGILNVCKRGAEPAAGWERTSKADKDGTPYYAPTISEKATRAKGKKEFLYHSRDGEPLIKVTRTDDGEGNRKFYQSHWNGQCWIKGVPADIQKQVPVYRYQQVRKAILSGKAVYMVEGEPCADALWAVGIIATTTLGGSGKYRSYGNYAHDLEDAQLILCPDRDEPGIKHMEEIFHDFPTAKWLYAPPGDWNWQHLPKSGGLDVADWLSSGATSDDVKAAVGEKQFGLPQTPYVEIKTDMDELNAVALDSEFLTVPPADEVFTQKAMDALYGDGQWISVDGHLYRWTSTHYKLVSTPVEKARIAKWCNSTPVQASNNRWQYSYAKSQYVENIWNWVLIQVAVDPEQLNPPGLNCLNGILQISWQGTTPSWELIKHDPVFLYTYVGEFHFDPNADSASCDRLLECLEPDQREIFLKTLAASLDLNTIRRLKSRIRALLCKGDGNNGKDSLRETVQLLYGVGVVSTTFNDFSQYENQGRKFPLAKLDQARVSWSSENSSVSQLDKLQSLKAAITGETLDMELKNETERPMKPRCIFLFNINDVPNMQASLEAIQSRWAVLTFDKTFKVGADPSKGELEADPRFRYDPDFLQREVVPALLNKILAMLPEVATKMINYTCTEQALQEIRQQSNHLLEFCQEIRLDYRPGERVYLGDLWDKLSQWYVDNGIAEVTVTTKGSQKKERLEFICEPARRGDKYIKALKYLYPRFSELFPKIKKERDYSHGERHGLFYLLGMGFGSPDGSSDGSPDGSLETRSESLGSLGSLSKPTLTYALEVVSKLSPTEQRALINFISKGANDSDPSDPRLSERVSSDPSDDPSDDPQVIQSSRPTIAANRSKASLKKVTAADGANVVGGIGNVGHDSSTKNFASGSTSPNLIVGSKCKAKRPQIWGIPENKVLTIRAIKGDIATVSFDGCRSLTGCEVLLSELEPVTDLRHLEG